MLNTKEVSQIGMAVGASLARIERKTEKAICRRRRML